MEAFKIARKINNCITVTDITSFKKMDSLNNPSTSLPEKDKEQSMDLTETVNTQTKSDPSAPSCTDVLLIEPPLNIEITPPFISLEAQPKYVDNISESQGIEPQLQSSSLEPLQDLNTQHSLLEADINSQMLPPDTQQLENGFLELGSLISQSENFNQNEKQDLVEEKIIFHIKNVDNGRSQTVKHKREEQIPDKSPTKKRKLEKTIKKEEKGKWKQMKITQFFNCN